MEITDSDATIAPSEDLIERFEPSQIPPIAPDGGPILEPAPVYLPVLTKSLCDRGPCRHRHVLAASMEAAEPMDGGSLERPKLGPDGEPIVKLMEPDITNWKGELVPGRVIYETEPYVPKQVTRLCYPSPGVRIELGEDEPVLECSLWDPEDPADPDVIARERRRAAYITREASRAADVEDLNREDSADSHSPHGVKRKK